MGASLISTTWGKVRTTRFARSWADKDLASTTFAASAAHHTTLQYPPYSHHSALTNRAEATTRTLQTEAARRASHGNPRTTSAVLCHGRKRGLTTPTHKRASSACATQGGQDQAVDLLASRQEEHAHLMALWIPQIIRSPTNKQTHSNTSDRSGRRGGVARRERRERRERRMRHTCIVATSWCCSERSVIGIGRPSKSGLVNEGWRDRFRCRVL